MVPTAILMMLVKSAWVRYDDFHLGGAMLVSGYTLKRQLELPEESLVWDKGVQGRLRPEWFSRVVLVVWAS